MGNHYEEALCKRCGRKTLHRVRRRCYVTKTGSGTKYESWHCLICNKYWKK